MNLLSLNKPLETPLEHSTELVDAGLERQLKKEEGEAYRMTFVNSCSERSDPMSLR